MARRYSFSILLKASQPNSVVATLLNSPQDMKPNNQFQSHQIKQHLYQAPKENGMDCNQYDTKERLREAIRRSIYEYNWRCSFQPASNRDFSLPQ